MQGQGGCVNAFQGTLAIVNTQMISATARLQGGAVYVSGLDNFTASGLHVMTASAQQGAALWLYTTRNASLHNCSFRNGTANWWVHRCGGPARMPSAWL